MNLTPLQSSFASGELSPLMRNRTEVEGHGTAVEIMENMVALSQGPARSRDSLVFFGEIEGHAAGRVETMQISTNRFIIAVFLNLEVRFVMSDGSFIVEGHVDNPRFSQFGQSWTAIQDNVASTVVFQRHQCTITPRLGVTAFAGIRQDVTLDDPLEIHEFHVHSDVESSNDSLHLLIGTALGLGDILDESVILNTAVVPFDPLGNTDLFIEVRNEAGGTAPDDNPINLSAVDILNEGAVSQSDPTPYSISDLPLLQFIEAPAGDTVYIAHPLHEPHYVLFDDILESVTFNPVPFDASIPLDWGENNWPSTGVVHQGRIYYASTPNEPEQIWASVVGNFEDMSTGSTEEDGFSVVNSHYGSISWMISSSALVFGTANAEYLISSVGPVIFIGDIQINRQSSYGSAPIRAQHIGDKIVYVTRDLKRLHSMQFNRDSQAWLSEEISFPSEHVLNAGAVNLAFEQYPHNLIWLSLFDGKWAACNYNRPMQIYGWHQHNTRGILIDNATGDQSGGSHHVTLMLRETGNLLLEISDPTGSPMDSRVTRLLDPPGTTVTGLEHLEGSMVQIVADGAVHPVRTVVNGEVELQLVSEFVQVGLGFRKRMLTLPFDDGSQKGSARAYTKRYKDIYLALLDSGVPTVNGQIPPVRTPPMPMNLSPPLTTGLIKISNLGYDKEAPVDIIQDDPVVLQITGIYGEVTQDKT